MTAADGAGSGVLGCSTNSSNNVLAVIGCFILKSFSCSLKSCKIPYVVHKCVKMSRHFTLAYLMYLFLNEWKYASGISVKRTFLHALSTL